ncbi:50S ribosomal protein L16 [Buchnera aphidicola]|uniref:50S ribosomal protein L16 n=1 Tax=Buchnera aphidicola TaxID=9 RepID=UPI0034649D2D
MLQPKRTKFRKMHKGKNRGVILNSNIQFGTFGIKAITRGRITARQIESARKVITKFIKKQGKIWIRIFPDKPITQKPLEVRMGKGKGNVEYWVALVKPGQVLYEVSGLSELESRQAFKLATSKLSVKTIFISKMVIK